MPPLESAPITGQKIYTSSCTVCWRKARAKTTTTTELHETKSAQPSSESYDISMLPVLSSTTSADKSVVVDEAAQKESNKIKPQDTKPKGSKFGIKELYNRIPSVTLIGIFIIIYLVSLFHAGYKSIHPAINPPATCALPANFDWRVQAAVEKALRRQRFDYLDHDP
jgi:hypothetical protein